MEQNISIWQELSWKTFSDRTKDLLIALIIAIIGIIGTYTIIGKSIKNDIQTQQSPGSKNIFNHTSTSSSIQNTTNQELLLIQGNFESEQMLKISYMNYSPSQKYLIDYGNGIRNIVNSATNYIKYQDAGIYYVLFYELVDDQWKLLSSQSISIK
ncbi:MAG: hypothetical protein IT267_02880 [Saprospiraceae bacterium]|nr:hypothetical protein [Saprospiraceae bacterium]